MLKILIADDDPASRALVAAMISMFGYEAVMAEDGMQALACLTSRNPPSVAILDWMMPGLEGIEVVRRVRASQGLLPPYLIMLSSKDSREDRMLGLEAGVDEYLSKPIDPMELKARVAVGSRIVALQQALADRVEELEEALAHVKLLQGIIPICSYCKKIRDDHKFWHQMEQYLSTHSEAVFSHAICPECWEKRVRPELDAMKREPPIG